jgi:hypothetical protein
VVDQALEQAALAGAELLKLPAPCRQMDGEVRAHPSARPAAVSRISPLNFAKINAPSKKLQNYTATAVEDGGRVLPSCLTALGRLLLP